MGFIRRFLTVIKAQLMGLTISQKLLIMLLALVMIGTVFFTVVFSAKPQMVPLLAQSMSADDINKVKNALEGKYEYQVSGDKVLVPAEQLYAIRGELLQKRAMPRDMSTAFRRMIENRNPFNTNQMNELEWRNALQEELTGYLQGFPYVESGFVTIDPGKDGGLGRPAKPSTATVNITLKGEDELSQSQVLAIAEMVTGAIAGMKRESVAIIANGERPYRAPSGDSPMPADLVAYKKAMETHLVANLAETFRGIDNVKIVVNVEPDLSQKHVLTTAFDPKASVVKEAQSSVREMNSGDGAANGGEPGVTPNTQLNAADAGGAGKRSGTTSSETVTKNEMRIGSTVEEKTSAPGVDIKGITASLNFPRSYFLNIFRRQAGDPKAEPKDKDADFKAVVDDNLKRLRAQAKTAIGAKTDEQINVDWYDDTASAKGPQLILASGGAGGAGGSVMAGVTQYAKQGILALAALMALGMMLMMVRRAVPAGPDDDVDTGIFFGGGGGKGKKRAGNVEQLDAADDVFGEANQGEAVLTGIELDDETLASRKMVDEVSTMIKENPENAAALVKKWMGKGK